MTWLVEYKEYFEALSYIAVLLGIPIGIVSYIKAAASEKRDREYGTYNALDEKYLDFQGLCFANPRLDIFDIADKQPVGDLTELEKKQELVAFTMLFAIFERAYLMYYDHDDEVKQRQWTGWNDYIIDYCKRRNFRAAWRISGETFDTEYQKFMKETLDECASVGTAASNAPAKIGHKETCVCCRHGIRKERPRICPICNHQFLGNGWDGIDAHWRAKHEGLMSYEQFRDSLCDDHKN